jgi:hypothetical protein
MTPTLQTWNCTTVWKNLPIMYGQREEESFNGASGAEHGPRVRRARTRLHSSGTDV